MSTPAEEDRKLTGAYAALEPDAPARARMQVRVLDGHERRPRSLWREWLNLLRARPIANGALIAAAAVILWVTTPLGAIPLLPRALQQLSSRAVASEKLIAYLQDLVQQAVAPLEGVTRRKALRSDGWFVRGSLFALVNRDARIVVRLVDEAAQAEAHALPGAELWRIGKKAPMRAWVLLPETFHDDVEQLGHWVRRAWATAPAKVAKRPRRQARRRTPR